MRWLTRTLPGVIDFNNTGVTFVLLSRFVALRWCSLTGMALFSNRGHGRWQILRFESCRAPLLRQLSQLCVVCGPVRSSPLRCGPFEDQNQISAGSWSGSQSPFPVPVPVPVLVGDWLGSAQWFIPVPSGLFWCPVVYQWFFPVVYSRAYRVWRTRAWFFKRINFLK